MKRILILHSQVPFQSGGAEVMVEGLRRELADRGHDVDVVSIPYAWNPPDKLLKAALAWRLLDLDEIAGEKVDTVICTKFPTWGVDHPNKVAWVVHQHRQAYDLHRTPYSEFGPDRDSEDIRQRVMEIDRNGLSECTRIFTISDNVGSRLERWTGLSSETLYPPVRLNGLQEAKYSNYILSVARLDALKRVDLLLASMSLFESDLRCLVVSDGPDRSELEQYVQSHGLQERVEFLGRVDDERLVQLYNDCRAVYYSPIDEDYGYTTVEAFSASKPIITTTDSGGVLEFVEDGENGLVVAPDPQAIARAVDAVSDADYSARLGRAGFRRVEGLGWDNVIAKLLGEA